MKEIIIGKNEDGKRFDSFLKAYLPNASCGFLYKMLRKKNITLNGKKADGKEKLNVGDKICIFFADETFDKFRGSQSGFVIAQKASGRALKEFGDLMVIYEDENVLFVNKPAGVLSQKSKPDDISLNDWLVEYLLQNGSITEKELETYRPSICNRLDRNTSGLVICAKSLKGARCMNGMLKDRTVDKYYRTIVNGKVNEGYSLKGYLYKDEAKNKVYIKENDPGDDRYSYIETDFIPVEYNADKNLTMLEVKLVTGKPHQIRAHLSFTGTPIVGDIKYGGKPYDGVKHQLLHSYRLVFPKEMEEGFEALAGREFVAQLPNIYLKYFSK